MLYFSAGSIDGELGEEGSGEIHSGESGDGELVTLSGGHHGHYMEISSVPYEENQVESSGDADELLKEDFLRLTKEFVLINPWKWGPIRQIKYPWDLIL